MLQAKEFLSADQSGDSKREVLDCIRQISRSLRVASRAAEREVGLSAAQLFVLQHLHTDTALSLNELADRMRTHQSSASVIVSKLVGRGLVVRKRSKSDARRLELSLTAGGRKVISKRPNSPDRILQQGLEVMNPGEVKKLSLLLAVLVESAGLSSPKEN